MRENFQQLYQRACDRKGGPQGLEALLDEPLSNQALAQLDDSRYLAEFTKKVFQSGFVWRVVENKWPDFEQHFFEFDIDKILMMPDEMLEQKARDPKIIRNLKKVWSIRENALMIKDVQDSHGGFAEFIASWPNEDVTGLWQYLKKHGQRLGGNTGPYALRTLGKDTFLLSRDVEQYLRQYHVITTGINTKSALVAAQDFFNEMQQQSGRSLTALSKIVAYASGDNRIFAEQQA